MVLNNLDALLITNPINIRYLTGFIGVSPEERESFALLSKNRLDLFTHSLYLEKAQKLSNNQIIQLSNKQIKEFTVIEISRESPLARQLQKIVHTENIKRLGFEEENITVAEFGKLQKELKLVTLVLTENRIEELRMIKRDDEIENIRQAANLTDQCFSYILEKLKPGISESEIAWEIESYFRNHGASCAFSPIVAFGKNSSQPHYLSNNNEPLTNNSLVLLDFGAKANGGYCSDMTRVVFIGKPKVEWIRAYNAVLASQEMAYNQILRSIDTSKRRNEKYTISGAEVDRSARDVIKKAGFKPYPHSLGHGVGLAIHEAPRLSIKKDATLKPSMVLTIEPGIYKEDQYGIRIEDLVLLKEDGIEILSQSPKKVIII